MMYRKNLPNWERWLRVIIGFALIVYGLMSAPSLLVMVLLVGSAVVIVGTGFIGFCPACALVGRKLVHQNTRKD